MKTLPLLILCIASISFAEDFKTIDGKEYKDATVTRVEPDGIVVKMKSGISKLYFTELPKDVQERFHYDAQKATSYSAEQAANYAAYQKQEEQGRHQREDADAQDKALSAQQQAINRNIQALQDRNAALQQEEEALQQRKREATHRAPSY